MQNFWNQEFLNNTIFSYGIFLLSLSLSVLAIVLLNHVSMRQLKKWDAESGTDASYEMVAGIKKYLLPLLFLIALYFCLGILYISPAFFKIIHTAVLAGGAVLGASFASSFLASLMHMRWQKKEADSGSRHMEKLIARLVKILIWLFIAILFLENIGVNISTLIAGLGVGGIAIAFAAQAILEDIFSYFTIFFDHPFEVGDFIVFGDQMGTVEHIGVKTTRLRSIGGEELIVSNKDLTNSRLSNYKTMTQRRVLFVLGVTYDTPMDKLREIPGILKDIISGTQDASFGRAHFSAFADSSLNFEIVYFVLSGDYDKYMDVQQDVNFRIKEKFDEEGIEFAFPTQTMYLQSRAADAAQKTKSD